MAKHPRKKQKLAKEPTEVPSKASRLEKLLDEESKDDEERRLESLLFGVKYVPKGKQKQKADFGDFEDEEQQSLDEDEESKDEDGQGREFEHLRDEDLFFVDDGEASHVSQSVPGTEDQSESSSNSDDETSDSSEGDGEPSSSRFSNGSSNPILNASTKSKRKAPAWVDPADGETAARISLTKGPSRLRKLRHTPGEDEISTKEYETRLRSQFERINPEPTWAKKARRGKHKTQQGSDAESDEDEDEDRVGDLLASSSGILANTSGKRSRTLSQGSIAIERVRDANHSSQNATSGETRVVSFHPKPNVPVLCVATADRRVRLFHVDGHLSPLLTTLHFPSLPMVSSTSALFHPQGNTLLLSGPRPFFYTYDLQQGTSTLHRRGLWGSESDHASVSLSASSRRRKRGPETPGSGGKGGGGNTETILHTAFSPNRGSMLAVAGKGGNVHLVDWTSGAGQVVGSLKCNTSSGGVQGLWWVPSGSADLDVLGDAGQADGHLAVLTGEAEVYIWDVGQRRCVKRWKDEGGYRGAGRTFACGGGRDGWMAIGSTSGFVNVYGSDSFAIQRDDDPSPATQPKLVKALSHLTTPISSLRFNHDAQLLAIASKDKKDAMRLIHLPSLTSYANWPTSSTPLGHVTAMDFATRSEYLAVGNSRGKVLLYHLRDYGAGGYGTL